jgi:hypothetical protein
VTRTGERRFNADDPPARELIIAGGLDAAEETIRTVASIRPAEERIPGVANGPFFACPQAAEMERT